MTSPISSNQRLVALCVLVLFLTSALAATPFAAETAWNKPPQKVHLWLSDVLCRAEWKAGVKGSPPLKNIGLPGKSVHHGRFRAPFVK